MIKETREAISDVYKSLGMIPMDTRKAEQVQVRAAIMSSLGRFMHDEMVGEVMDKDRTTVMHHRRNHSSNMKVWKGYAEVYRLADGILSLSMGQTIKDGKIKAAKARIKVFEDEIALLKETIKSLQNSEE